MLTNDIKQLPEGSGCYAALLTRQGLMESDLWVHAFAEELWLECPPCAVDKVLSTLRKHIVSEVVKLDELTESCGILSLQGPKAGEVMERTLDVSLAGMQPLEHRSLARNGASWIVVLRDRTGRGGYDLWLPQPDLADLWRRWTGSEGVRAAGLRALDLARIEAGIPWYGTDMDDRTLPMEIGLHSAISMKKGCYRGQEIVARVIHRGHLDRSLGGIAIDYSMLPSHGAEVRAQGAKIGTVTSAAHSPQLEKPLALAVLKLPYLEPGTPVEIDYGDGFRPGRVVSLPVKTSTEY